MNVWRLASLLWLITVLGILGKSTLAFGEGLCTDTSSWVGPQGSTSEAFHNDAIYEGFPGTIVVFQKITLQREHAVGLCSLSAFVPRVGLQEDKAVELSLFSNVRSGLFSRPGKLLARTQEVTTQSLASHPNVFSVVQGSLPPMNVLPGEYWIGLRGVTAFGVSGVSSEGDNPIDGMSSFFSEPGSPWTFPEMFADTILNLWEDGGNFLKAPFFINVAATSFDGVPETENEQPQCSSPVLSVTDQASLSGPTWSWHCSARASQEKVFLQRLHVGDEVSRMCTAQVLVLSPASELEVKVAVYSEVDGKPGKLLSQGESRFFSPYPLTNPLWRHIDLESTAPKGDGQSAVWMAVKLRDSQQGGSPQLPFVQSTDQAGATKLADLGFEEDFPLEFSQMETAPVECGSNSEQILQDEVDGSLVWPVSVTTQEIQGTFSPTKTPSGLEEEATNSPSVGWERMVVRFDTEFNQAVHLTEDFRDYLEKSFSSSFKVPVDQVRVVDVRKGSVLVEAEVQGSSESSDSVEDALRLLLADADPFGLGDQVTVSVPSSPLPATTEQPTTSFITPFPSTASDGEIPARDEEDDDDEDASSDTFPNLVLLLVTIYICRL